MIQNNFAKDKTYQDESEPLHVFIQADTEEQLRNGIRLIEPLLDPTTEEHLKHKMLQKQALAVKLGLVNEQGCENCGEKGHRTWACPLNLGTFDKPQIQCEICKDKSHPTCDCPYKKGIYLISSLFLFLFILKETQRLIVMILRMNTVNS